MAPADVHFLRINFRKGHFFLSAQIRNCFDAESCYISSECN